MPGLLVAGDRNLKKSDVSPVLGLFSSTFSLSPRGSKPAEDVLDAPAHSCNQYKTRKPRQRGRMIQRMSTLSEALCGILNKPSVATPKKSVIAHDPALVHDFAQCRTAFTEISSTQAFLLYLAPLTDPRRPDGLIVMCDKRSRLSTGNATSLCT
eukprot:s3948_g8.t1